MAYREVAPPPALATHVACLWARRGTAQRVVPDGCVDLVWTGEALIVAGPATRAVVPSVSPGETKLGLRFRVGAAGHALGFPAGELLDRSPPLADVWDDGAELADRVAESSGAEARLRVLAEGVSARLRGTPPPDPAVRAAVLQLSRPRTRIAHLTERIGISERQLRRRFERHVGYAPRTLARVLRLQRVLALAGRDRDLARLAAEAGYADQPHLTRDCVRLASLPPAALLDSGAGPAGEPLIRA